MGDFMAAEIKRPTTYEEQIDILRNRGCFISDEAFCKIILSSVNYYRLSAYFLPFRNQDGSYIPGTSFHQVYRIYEFDRKLRGILFSAIEEIEIFLRTKLTYCHSHKYGATGYLDPETFSAKHNHEKFTASLTREITSNDKSLFVRHHIEKYEGTFPLWAATELFTFGMLSYFFSDLKISDQNTIANKYFDTSRQNISSWLRCCTDLRNICAHYGRLYFRIFPAIPAGIQISPAVARRLWGQMLVLRNLFPDREKWNREVLPALESLLEEYRGDISLYHIAFPPNWDSTLRK